MKKRKPIKKRRQRYGSRANWQPRYTNKPVVSGRLVGGLLGGGLVVLGAAYIVLATPLFAVSSVAVQGAQALDPKQLEQTARGASETRWGPLVTKSLAVVNQGKVETALREKHGDIAKVSVGKKWPNGLTVKIEERQQALLWQSKDRYYLVDRQGIAYTQAEPRSDLVSVQDGSGLPVEVGKPVVGSSFIKILEQIQKDMTAANLPVKQFRIPETTFEVQAVTEAGWYALFDTTRNVSSQALALQEATKTGKPAQYADLRVPGRVYIR